MGYCKYCGKNSGKYDLCKECYELYQEGLIDKCKCGNYKDSDYTVCKECYEKQKKNKSGRKAKISDASIKGRLAEAIVEEMFLSMGYRVFRFGMENTVPGFADRYLPKKGEVAEEVRKMPDFIVVKDSKIAYIEVKYRTSGKFDFNDFYARKGGYPYKSAFFILVTPKHILIQKASRLEKGEDFMYLNECEYFDTDKDIILKYIEFCKKFFGNC
jgi:hypothetical protein